eukprot:846020-Amphidinium_carterae.1
MKSTQNCAAACDMHSKITMIDTTRRESSASTLPIHPSSSDDYCCIEPKNLAGRDWGDAHYSFAMEM